jgi:DNA-directed RNA polymerase specialized sigma24 family protein|tara:strand:- start:13245 stop:13643 length:399 start_codon:yes stop_codon:yes gene_type:complete
MPKRVFPKDTQESAWLFDLANRRHPSVPASEIQAVMEALPYVEPLRPFRYTAKFEDPIKDALASLDDLELEIVMLLAFEQLSLRVAGRILGIPKTTLARRRDAIYQKLRTILNTNEEIREHLLNGTRRNNST